MAKQRSARAKPGRGVAVPILSMTGFGSGSARAGGFRAEVEIRAVNGRYLSLKTHLAGEYAFLEEPLRALVEKQLLRGSADLRAEVTPERAEVIVALDEPRVRAYVAAWRDLAGRMRLPGELTVGTLAGQGDLFVAGGSRRSWQGAEAAVLAAAAAALSKLQAMRRREGAGLRADLERHLAAIERLRAEIAARNPETVRQLAERAAERVKKLAEAVPGAAPRPEDLAREVAWWADRCDVSEEMQRLASHVGEFRAALAAGGAVGKRLEFLVQELHREANTAGSKAADSGVSRLVVEMKTIIEQLREQVQNVL